MSSQIQLWGRSIYAFVMGALPARMSVCLQFYRHHHRWPKLKNPQTFSEMIQEKKFSSEDRVLSTLADKAAVKDYIAEILGNDWVVPTLWVGKELPPLKDRDWEVPFVIKTTHSSGTNIFIRDQSDLQWDVIEKKVQLWLSGSGQTPGHLAEYHYKKIPPRVIIEPYIGRGRTLPVDYKFFCFDGHVALIQVDLGRSEQHTRALFDTEWNRLEARLKYPSPPTTMDIPRPETFAELLDAAKLISKGFDFVRVDFYEFDGQPLVGELTFFPGSGFERFYPRSLDIDLGKRWVTSQNNSVGCIQVES